MSEEALRSVESGTYLHVRSSFEKLLSDPETRSACLQLSRIDDGPDAPGTFFRIKDHGAGAVALQTTRAHSDGKPRYVSVRAEWTPENHGGLDKWCAFELTGDDGRAPGSRSRWQLVDLGEGRVGLATALSPEGTPHFLHVRSSWLDLVHGGKKAEVFQLSKSKTLRGSAWVRVPKQEVAAGNSLKSVPTRDQLHPHKEICEETVCVEKKGASIDIAAAELAKVVAASIAGPAGVALPGLAEIDLKASFANDASTKTFNKTAIDEKTMTLVVTELTQTSSKIKGAFLFCGAASWQLKVAGKVIRIVAADKHALAELQGIMDVKAQAKVAELKKQAKEAATSPPEQV